MNESDKQKFMEIMLLAGEVLNKKDMSKPFLGIYFETLKEFDIETISKAFTAHLKCTGKEGTFFPKPADIIRQIKGTDKQVEEEQKNNAEIAWSEIVRKMSSLGSYQNFDSEDKYSVAAVISMGGWSRLCEQSTNSNMPWLKKEFIDVYTAMQPRDAKSLPPYAKGFIEQENDKKTGVIQAEGGFLSVADCIKSIE